MDTCVQPNPGGLVLEGKSEALDGGVEGESHHHKHRPGARAGQSDGGESPLVMIISAILPK